MKYFTGNRNKKVGVFKIKQHPEVKNDAAHKQGCFLSFIPLYINGIGKKIINNGGNDHQYNKSSAGLIKKIKRKENKDVSPYFKIFFEFIIQCDKDGKEENKETIVK